MLRREGGSGQARGVAGGVTWEGRGFQKVDKGMRSGGKVCEQCRGEPGRGDTGGGEQEGRGVSGVFETVCVGSAAVLRCEGG